jgi:hypothetical protein
MSPDEAEMARQVESEERAKLIDIKNRIQIAKQESSPPIDVVKISMGTRVKWYIAAILIFVTTVFFVVGHFARIPKQQLITENYENGFTKIRYLVEVDKHGNYWKNGKYQDFWENGNIKRECYYLDNKEMPSRGIKLFYKTGSLCYERSPGLYEYSRTRYDENGFHEIINNVITSVDSEDYRREITCWGYNKLVDFHFIETVSNGKCGIVFNAHPGTNKSYVIDYNKSDNTIRCYNKEFNVVFNYILKRIKYTKLEERSLVLPELKVVQSSMDESKVKKLEDEVSVFIIITLNTDDIYLQCLERIESN